MHKQGILKYLFFTNLVKQQESTVEVSRTLKWWQLQYIISLFHLFKKINHVAQSADFETIGISLQIKKSDPNFIWEFTSFMQPPLLDNHHTGHVGGQGGGSRFPAGRDAALFPSLGSAQEPGDEVPGFTEALQWRLPIRWRGVKISQILEVEDFFFPPLVWILTLGLTQ